MNRVVSAPASQRATVNALQRVWLHELGLEKLWLDAPPAPAARAAPSAHRVAEPAPAYAATGSAPITLLKDKTPAQQPAPNAAKPALRAAPLPADLARLDLAALRATVQSCTACGLAAGRKQAVFGTGAQTRASAPVWLIVGEAPGGEEDRQGLPFVGPSGQLLDAMLAAVGRSRARDVYIANVVKCRPPGNRNPKPEEIAACSPYLHRQIELLAPGCILVMGRFAAQTLLATDAPVGSLRGRVHSFTLASGRAVPVVVTFHPAYLLRSPQEKAKAWADLQRAVALGGGEVPLTPRPPEPAPD